MILTNILLSVFMIYSCDKEYSKNDTLDNLLTKKDLTTGFIQLIPFKGILIDSDSLLIGKTNVNDILHKIDTSSINYKLVVDEPKQLVMKTKDSPPPCIGDCPKSNYKHKPDGYFTNYSASLQVDSFNFEFGFSQSGKDILDSKIYIDSLKLFSIKVINKFNAGLYDDLKIGDSYEQIFKYYKEPNYCNQPDMIRKEIRENGVLFTIETDKSQSENLGKIIKIEVNCLTKY